MICAFGCNQEAKFIDKCGKPCCSEHRENCPSVKNKINTSVMCNKCGNFFAKNGLNKHKTICLLNNCLNCNNPINKNKKFCNQSCSATYNNKFENSPKRKMKEEFCIRCNKLIHSNRKFCSNECQQNYKYELYMKNYFDNKNNGSQKTSLFSIHLKKYLLKQADYKCFNCGFNTPHPITKKTILQVHHIDRDWTNNSLENLQILCPTCHALTDNYGNLNKHLHTHLKVRPSSKYKSRRSS